MKRVVYLLLILALGGLVVVAWGAALSGLSASAINTTPTPATPAAFRPVARRAVAVGSSLASIGHPVRATFSSDSWQLTVTAVTRHSWLQGITGPIRAQGVYVLVYLTATNVGQAPEALTVDGQFALYDSQGRVFDQDVDATSAATVDAGRAWAVDTVQPSFTTHTVVGFDVARDARGLVLWGENFLSFDGRPLVRLTD